MTLLPMTRVPQYSWGSASWSFPTLCSWVGALQTSGIPNPLLFPRTLQCTEEHLLHCAPPLTFNPNGEFKELPSFISVAGGNKRQWVTWSSSLAGRMWCWEDTCTLQEGTCESKWGEGLQCGLGAAQPAWSSVGTFPTPWKAYESWGSSCDAFVKCFPSPHKLAVQVLLGTDTVSLH